MAQLACSRQARFQLKLKLQVGPECGNYRILMGFGKIEIKLVSFQNQSIQFAPFTRFSMPLCVHPQNHPLLHPHMRKYVIQA